MQQKKKTPPEAELLYTPIFQSVGLAKNEARIYETLLRFGELSIGQIAVKSHVHRRNVYDSIHRLVERGLVFEIIERTENRYEAVDPKKLKELLEQREQALSSVMPQLQELYEGKPHEAAVYVYRGLEGWKNYMRDILRLGEDFYCIGAKGGWMEARTRPYFEQFIREAKRQKIGYYHLFEYEVYESNHPILQHVGSEYKFLPKGYSAPASVDLFGDRVNIVSNIHLGGVEADMWFTVIMNQLAMASVVNRSRGTSIDGRHCLPAKTDDCFNPGNPGVCWDNARDRKPQYGCAGVRLRLSCEPDQVLASKNSIRRAKPQVVE